MAVLDVSVLQATGIIGVSAKKNFCVYVRLQGQAMRTRSSSGKREEVHFNERFRFQYNPDRKTREKNQLFVELWTKSILSQACVSVAWLDMDKQDFHQGVPVTFRMQGGFEGKEATVVVVVTPVDFGTGQQQQYQQQAAMAAMPNQGSQQQQPYYAQQQPAVGVPMQEQPPYSSAGYYENPNPVQPHKKLDPITGQPIQLGPASPPHYTNPADRPPPLYGNGGGSYPEAEPAPPQPQYQQQQQQHQQQGNGNGYPSKPL